MKDQTQKDRTLAPAKTILLVILFALSTMSCDSLMSVTAELSDNECIEVSNYISPEYVLFAGGGTFGGKKEIKHKESKTFFVKTDKNSRRTRTHLSISVYEIATDREVNSVKAEIRFRGNRAGCARYQMKDPNVENIVFQ